MKLYMKQKVFSWKDKFHIFDENQEEKYYAESEVFTLGKKLHVYKGENEVCFIHQKLLSFLPKFYLNVNGEDVAEVIKDFTFFHSEYTVNGLDWVVVGDFTSHEYTIKNSNSDIIATISKKWLSWGDTYEINITNEKDEVYALSIVLIIDAILAQQAAAASASAAT